ncbi:hypothetical protein [Bacteroides sp. 51]|uniref:hypothetical protein n=1 Tax=Bacteroides sp. 51 TaxID=2302938 RepID=UPI0013CFA94B|nr:hypothetical protein [Bacteroides sp. 51]NDV83909.1 hypothetical protein [Bacteroides sp. 51]
MSSSENFFRKGSDQQQTTPVVDEQETFRIDLDTLGENEIINIFDEFIKEKRQIVIPIGFPAAGKSLFLSSLMYYAERNSDKKWNGNSLSAYPFEQGNLSRDTMIKYFDDKAAYPVTASGTLDLIGINLKPSSNKLPELKLAFVDLAGEDLRNFRADKRNNLNPKITAIFKACRLTKPIFCLITPYDSRLGHAEENSLFANFLSYISEDKNGFNPLYQQAKYIAVVSQWDKNINAKKEDAESYIKSHRPALHTEIEGRDKHQFAFGEYSVGVLEDTRDRNGQPVVLIRRIANDYPHNFWCSLYKLATNKSLDSKSWLAKLFGY